MTRDRNAQAGPWRDAPQSGWLAWADEWIAARPSAETETVLERVRYLAERAARHGYDIDPDDVLAALDGSR
jgi:hypothetical protein